MAGSLPLGDPRDRLPRPRHPPPPHPALPSSDQRQGRALHPHPVGGWAYGAIYAGSAERTAALDGWLWTYNHRRPHGALSHKPPIARLTSEQDNLARFYT